MTVYEYSSSTGEYMTEIEADDNPLDPRHPLIPAYATVLPPPEKIINKTPVFSKGMWHLVNDYRNEAACCIDDNGFFIGKRYYKLGESPKKNELLTDIPDKNIFKPKWDGTHWIQSEDNYINKTGCEIDEKGYFIKTFLFMLDTLPDETHILTNPPDKGIFKPRWDGKAWIKSRENYSGKNGCIINNENYFMDTMVFTANDEPDKTHIIAEKPSDDFLRPKWDICQWIEGASLCELQDRTKSLINTKCSKKASSGFYSYAEREKDTSGKYVLKLYKSDAYHGLQISNMASIASLYKLGMVPKPVLLWKSADQENEECHYFSEDAIIHLYCDYTAHCSWCKTTSDELVDQIYKTTEISELDKIAFPNEPKPDIPA